MSKNKKRKGPAESFLDSFLDPKRRRPKLTRQTIRSDRFDQEAHDQLKDDMQEFAVSSDRLADYAPKSGRSMFEDDFFSLYKARPKQVDPKEVRPSHLVNYAVLREAMDLDEYRKLHSYSIADDIGAGLASISMEPELENIYDRLKKEQEQADQLQEQMEHMIQLEGDMSSLGGKPEDDEEAKNFQEQQSLIQQQMDMLEKQMRGDAKELDQGLDDAKTDIQTGMRQAMDKAIDDADLAESAAEAWGLSPGGLKRLPAKERIELAQRLDNPKFRRIAELFGPMRRMAFAEQSRKVYHARDEVLDVEMGNDIPRLLPTELGKLRNPSLRLDFLVRFADKRLLQYNLQGTEKVAKGGIIFCEDGSGSMGGDREIWAKAVGLCLLRISEMQKRPFFGIHFGGTGEARTFDFKEKQQGVIIEQVGYDAEEPNEVSHIDGVMDFAETFFCGGTDFMTPLSIAIGRLKEEHKKEGRVKADIVFCTDGYCGVDEAWLEEFKTTQKELDIRVWGVVIGGSPDSEPLVTICDGRVFTITDLQDGNQMADIFRHV